MRLFSYIMTYDTGFAPNPFHGYCTLATCKPTIRRTAHVGDWILGTGSKNMHAGDKRIDKGGYLVYAMRVTEEMTFEEYWNDLRFRDKQPVKGGGKKRECGDNIYFRDPCINDLRQVDWCFHCPADKGRDTKTDRVLISKDFIYWGGYGPPMPPEFTGLLSTTQGHKCRFREEDVQRFVQWLRETGDKGVVGKPTDFKHSSELKGNFNRT